MFARPFRIATLAGLCALAGCATLPDTPSSGDTSALRVGAPSVVPATTPSAQAIANAQKQAPLWGTNVEPATDGGSQWGGKQEH